jgi:signal transduction histidine kinase
MRPAPGAATLSGPPVHLTSTIHDVPLAERSARADIAEQLRAGPRRRLMAVSAQLTEAHRDRERMLALVGRARVTLSGAIDELQQLARGIRPTLLSDCGLEPGWTRPAGTADQTRRAIERDLHDGAQQRLVSLAVTLQFAERLIGRGEMEKGTAVLEEALDMLDAGMQELMQLAIGIHPETLRNEGLEAALGDLVDRSALSVGLDVTVRHPIEEASEAAAYFVVSEALTNTLKHADARHARVTVRQRRGELVVIVADDGRGGADMREGSGLRGLSDRVRVLGGRLLVDSPHGEGTVLTAVLPGGERRRGT